MLLVQPKRAYHHFLPGLDGQYSIAGNNFGYAQVVLSSGLSLVTIVARVESPTIGNRLFQPFCLIVRITLYFTVGLTR